MSFVIRVLLCVSLFAVKLGAATHCDNEYCPGADDYCCYDDDNNYVCCSVDPWWLWFIIAMVLFLLLSCIGCCIRARRRHTRYLIITGERPVVSHTSIYPAYGACSTEAPAPVLVAPVYATTVGHQQPPPYTPEAQNKGNPPPYKPPY